jgi:hypothetical protein
VDRNANTSRKVDAELRGLFERTIANTLERSLLGTGWGECATTSTDAQPPELTLDELRETMEHVRANKPPDVWYALDFEVERGTCLRCKMDSMWVPPDFFVLHPLDFEAIPPEKRLLMRHIREWRPTVDYASY